MWTLEEAVRIVMIEEEANRCKVTGLTPHQLIFVSGSTMSRFELRKLFPKLTDLMIVKLRGNYRREEEERKGTKRGPKPKAAKSVQG